MSSLNEEITVVGELSPDGQNLVISNSFRAKRLWKHLQGTQLEITFKKFYRKRSLAQNRYIWGVCVPDVIRFLVDTTGVEHSKEAVYSFLRTRVIGNEMWVETIDDQDIIFLSGKRFSQMNTKEFSDAVEKIVLYYAERGLKIRLPKPKTNNFITDYEQDAA
ncbi:hypothetical protein LCGC14_0278760 [marine sediment metagenome]|uniref:Uncharacterized protein n=1 Tax=marine sediment metagenome TaxID=412755 RepID=A0A0F9X276_9ZZZZ